MKFLSLAIIPSLLCGGIEGFSMLTPRFSDFPQRFGKYLKEFDQMIQEPDWPSSFMEEALEDFKNDSSMIFHRASPKYEVLEKHDLFSVKIDVPGFKAEEIEVGLKAGGRLLTVSGVHEEKGEGRSISSKFQQNFSLDPSIQIEQMTADLMGETLVVKAPRIDALPECRNIPIVSMTEDPTVDEQKTTSKLQDEKSGGEQLKKETAKP
jgi:HSP20 family molecular chaperone IbpA